MDDNATASERYHASIPKNRIKEFREARRLTQQEVAIILGKHFTLVSHHENHQRRLTEEDIKAYAKLFKVETYELFITNG